MNVVESNNITSTISYLRNNIYTLSEFKTDFCNNLTNSLNANSIDFSPDQYGGWIISVNFNKSKFGNTISSNSSDFYLTRVVVALHNTLLQLEQSCPDVPNLVNVTLVGSDNLIIRI
jgi:hypothetical protein